jgi:hypothetical protein
MQPSKLIGKTIAAIEPDGESVIEGIYCYAEQWLIRFTDGSEINLHASYDDSCVHLKAV